jgi:hypothetical protein
MAQNDIIVAKEGAGGVLSEIALAASDLKLGTTANLPLRTGSGGVVEAGSFSNTAGSFCAGDDARLSDARTPSSTLAHKSSHATGGTDAIAPSDIGAIFQWSVFEEAISASPTTLAAGRARRITISTTLSTDTEVLLPTTGNQDADLFQLIRSGNIANGRILVKTSAGGSTLADLGTKDNEGRSFTFRWQTGGSFWAIVPVDSHGADKVTSGTLDVARLPVGTGSTQVAAGNHTHVVADVTGAAASGSITTSGLTQATARILGRTTASTGAIEEITVGSGLSLSAGELSATGSGITAVGASTADVLSVSGSDLVADDPNADRIVFFDDSEGRLRYLEAGSGLSISGTTMTVTATGGATNLWIPASAFIPKTTAGCGVDSRETSTNDQNFDELLFDTGSDEFADALVIMPSNYNNGTVTARFYWTAASGSGTVEWAIQGRAFANDDALDTAAGTKQAVNDTLLAANDMHITSATSACTIGGTPAANTPIQFTIYRDVSEDTLAVDARLLGVEIIFN